MSPGYTVEEIEALVEEYMALRQGQKGPWLKARSISKYQLHRWRQAYLAGDLARGLVSLSRCLCKNVTPGFRVVAVGD